MKAAIITVAFIVGTAWSLPNYSTSTSQEYSTGGNTYETPTPSTPSYSTGGNSYDNPTPSYDGGERCSYVDEVVYEDKCENVVDRICTTSYDEVCKDVVEKTCRAVVTTTQKYPCYNVTETVCTLKEDVNYKVVDSVYTVQVCNRDTERICDTQVEMEMKTEERTQWFVNYSSLFLGFAL